MTNPSPRTSSQSETVEGAPLVDEYEWPEGCALLLGNDYTGHFTAEDYAIEGLGEKLRRSPDALASWLAEHTDEHWRAPPVDGDGGALDFSRALYDLRPLDAWPLDAKVREEALDGSPAVDAGGACAPGGEHRLFLRLRETLAVPGRAMELEPVVAQLADDLARRLDDGEADALAEMLERFPDRLLEARRRESYERWLRDEYQRPATKAVTFEEPPPSLAARSLSLLALPVRVPVAIGAAIAGWVVGLFAGEKPPDPPASGVADVV